MRQEFDEPWENSYCLQNHPYTFFGNEWLSVCCKKSNALDFSLLLTLLRALCMTKFL